MTLKRTTTIAATAKITIRPVTTDDEQSPVLFTTAPRGERVPGQWQNDTRSFREMGNSSLHAANYETRYPGAEYDVFGGNDRPQKIWIGRDAEGDAFARYRRCYPVSERGWDEAYYGSD